MTVCHSSCVWASGLQASEQENSRLRVTERGLQKTNYQLRLLVASSQAGPDRPCVPKHDDVW